MEQLVQSGPHRTEQRDVLQKTPALHLALCWSQRQFFPDALLEQGISKHGNVEQECGNYGTFLWLCLIWCLCF